MNIFKAPEKVDYSLNPMSVFLAGSIEMGKAVDWQMQVTNDLETFDVTILNPRRDDWDTSWVQSINNDNFNEQVTWEMDALDEADVIFLFFSNGTQSPISLLELGLYAHKPMIVCCENEFWRRGNIEMVCDRHDIPLYCELKDSVVALTDFFDLYQNHNYMNIQYQQVLRGLHSNEDFLDYAKNSNALANIRTGNG